MLLRLTNCGHRYIHQRLSLISSENERLRGDARMLFQVRDRLLYPYEDTKLQNQLVERGLLEVVPETTSYMETVQRYERNPLENIYAVNFEMTTKCNLHCLHCRSGIVKRTTETDIDSLKSAAELFLQLGVTGFVFIGGEVTKYAEGWLDLIQHIHTYFEANKADIPQNFWGGLRIAVLTSGWWLEQKNFVAAGRRYVDERAFLRDLRAHGLTHLLFSIDGPEVLHDRWRQVPGLYRRIVRGIPRVREQGLSPRVSLVTDSAEHYKHGFEYIVELADLLYDFPPETNKATKIDQVLKDPGNLASSFVDINNGVQLSEGRCHVSEIDASKLRCKAFFRPYPKLTISASGELAICPLMNSAERYGNIHKRPLTELLNTMHENLLFQLHAEHKIGDYMKFLDPEVFGERFDHLCSLRTIVNLLARKMDAVGLAPESVTDADAQTIAQINRDVARWTGHEKLLHRQKDPPAQV